MTAVSALAVDIDAPGSRRPTRQPSMLGGWLLLMPAAVLLGGFFVYPVAKLMLLSVQDGTGQPSLVHYARLLGSPVYLSVLLNTLHIAFWTALVSLLAGYPVAYAIARAEPRSRSRLMLWVLLPFWTSFLVRTFA